MSKAWQTFQKLITTIHSRSGLMQFLCVFGGAIMLAAIGLIIPLLPKLDMGYGKLEYGFNHVFVGLAFGVMSAFLLFRAIAYEK